MKKLLYVLIALAIAGNLYSQKKTSRSKTFTLPSSIEEQKSQLVKKFEPPIILILNPSTPYFKTKDNSLEVIIKVQNIESEKQVKLQQDGRIIVLSKTTRDKDVLLFYWNANLNEGKNNFEIVASNDSGENKVSFIIEKEKIILPPQITLITPDIDPSTAYLKTKNKSLEIAISIKNLENERQANFKQNGKLMIPDKTSKESDGISFTWNVILNDGLNNFDIIAKNESDEKKFSFTIEREVYLPAPQIALVSPNINPFNTRTSISQIIVDIKYVDEKSTVLIKRGYEKFTSPRKERIANGYRYTWDIDLIKGLNEFEVIANQKGQNSSLIVQIRYDEPVRPKLIPNLFAVIVGISKNQTEKLNLKYATADAKLFYDELNLIWEGTNVKKNIAYLVDSRATRKNILKEIKDKSKQADPNDLILLYFASHGDRINDNYYLLPYDTEPDNIDVTAIDINDIKKILEGSSSKRKILIADACHSGGFSEGKRTLSKINEFLLELGAKIGTFILTSASGSEEAQEGPQWGGGHGVFTYYLVEGMKGKADEDKNKIVTIKELYEYVRAKVKEGTNSQQIPQLKEYGSDQNFPISVIK